jgi:hypothetical protein
VALAIAGIAAPSFLRYDPSIACRFFGTFDNRRFDEVPASNPPPGKTFAVERRAAAAEDALLKVSTDSANEASRTPKKGLDGAFGT